MDKENTISVDQLRIGVYVYLDVGWMNHPFSFNNFLIRNEEQLRTIRSLGLAKVRWDPARSETKPLPQGGETVAAMATGVAAAPTSAAEQDFELEKQRIIAVKKERMARLAAHRAATARVEQAFASAVSVVREITRSIHAKPEQTRAATDHLIGEIVDSLLAAPELAIQVMTEKPGAEDVYLHSLNVSVLSMILGRELRLPAEVVHLIGMGALFHDIGLSEVPGKILNNPGPLSKAERDFREQHCQYGLDIGRKAGLPTGALNVIFQHHECFDGSGYPKKLKGELIDPLARLVSIVNVYDNLCNPVSIANALTPHEALSHMFAQQRSKFDPKLLQAFIRFMGVYPPGTIVGLSNEALAMVIKVVSTRPLRPTVILYDPAVPKQEAIILDLDEEPDINISRAIRPVQLPPAVYNYLSPRRRVSYYFDAGGSGAKG